MAENTSIEWTDHTFNPWWGCTHVHEGCRNCYAETWANRFGVKWGPSGVRRLSSPAVWKQPLKWNRAAEKSGVRAKVFCSSMADVFEDWQGSIVDSNGDRVTHDEGSHTFEYVNQFVTMDDLRRRLFNLIDATPWLDWQLLTKRPENIRRMWVDSARIPKGLEFAATSRPFYDNVWLGTSVSDQASADKQIPELVACRDLSPVLFLSAEPLLGPVDLDFACERRDVSCIDWVIAGGESGPGARPMHPEWARSLRDQCQAADVAFLFKQHGEWIAVEQKPVNQSMLSWSWPSSQQQCLVYPDGRHVPPFDSWTLRVKEDGFHPMCRIGKKEAGRLLDGREWNEFPEPEYVS